VRVTRKVRLKAIWILVVPFLWLARPTPATLAVGAALAGLGAALRAWAAGTIRKERELSTGGPYAHTRNPLYLGSFLIGLGVTIAGARWAFVALFLAFFAVVYGAVIKKEARLLGELFGARYADYAKGVPLFVPRLAPYRAPADAGGVATGGFTLERWRRNREYEALLGVIAGFALLTARMLWG
jgi:protein-S-isoprenylcysteine O-methyltransferase Ste14